jgi:hypothetical protein
MAKNPFVMQIQNLFFHNYQLRDSKDCPGASYSATGSLARFENKKVFSAL